MGCRSCLVLKYGGWGATIVLDEEEEGYGRNNVDVPPFLGLRRHGVVVSAVVTEGYYGLLSSRVEQ